MRKRKRSLKRARKVGKRRRRINLRRKIRTMK
jgi:hypothetical protein